MPKTILKESIRIILFASLISSLGGLALENIKTVFISLMPLVILFPALNDMIGDYGAILSSRFSTMLHKGEVKKQWWTPEVKKMFIQVMFVAIVTAFLSATIALAVSKYYGTAVTILFTLKIFAITVTDVLVLVMLLFFTSIYAGLHYFRKHEDPNNFLIPITTSIADLGNMVLLAILIILFF